MKKLFFILGASFLLSACNRIDNHQPQTSVNLHFDKVDSIAQTFISHRENLNRLDICVRNRDRILLPMRFSLYEVGSTTPVRSLDFSSGNIDNQDCTRFQFQPIPDSQNKKYSAVITVLPNTDPSVLPDTYLHLQYSLSVEAHAGGDFTEGEAYLGREVTPYDLHFKTFFQQSFREIWQESLSSLGRRLTLDPFFMVPYVTVVLAVSYLTYKKR